MKYHAALIIAGLLLALHARGDLTASLSPSIQNSGAGQTVVFSGTLANSGTCPLYLNDIVFTLSGSAGTELVSGSNAFYANVPGILPASETYAGPLFSISVQSAAPPATYTGSVTVQGGSNIFTGNDLANTSFTDVSPTVSITTISATAAEFGPVEGAYSITRTGGTGTSLSVSFTIGGTAINGMDYEAISSPVTIAANATSATVIIDPILEQAVLGARTVILSLQSSAQYTLGASTSSTVTILDTPYNNWRAQNFGSSDNSPRTAPNADWSGGGIPNIVAYALGMNPTNPDQSLLPTVALVSNYLTLFYVPSEAATDVTFSVEASTDLVNWSATDTQEASDPNPNGVAFRYIYPAGPSYPAAFLRLEVNQLDW